MRDGIPFVKMHGLGNDFIVVERLPAVLGEAGAAAAALCDRHLGIGADGLIAILPHDAADVRMVVLNPDGSEAEMCGNALRCAVAYAVGKGLGHGDEVRVLTRGGLKRGVVMERSGLTAQVRAEIGRPPEPVFLERELALPGRTVTASFLWVGVPHVVIFVEELQDFPVAEIGRELEWHRGFHTTTNVMFVQVLNTDELAIRPWERAGVGESLACGTGACASLVVAHLTRRNSRRARVHFPGGTMVVEWNDEGELVVTGSATTVFSGHLPLR